MTTPDRLEQVLTELEALERDGQIDLGRGDGPYRAAAQKKYIRELLSHWPYLRAKLRAAGGMGKALEIAEAALKQKSPSRSLRASTCSVVSHALAAWRQAGEEE